MRQLGHLRVETALRLERLLSGLRGGQVAVHGALGDLAAGLGHLVRDDLRRPHPAVACRVVCAHLVDRPAEALERPLPLLAGDRVDVHVRREEHGLGVRIPHLPHHGLYDLVPRVVRVPGRQQPLSLDAVMAADHLVASFGQRADADRVAEAVGLDAGGELLHEGAVDRAVVGMRAQVGQPQHPERDVALGRRGERVRVGARLEGREQVLFAAGHHAAPVPAHHASTSSANAARSRDALLRLSYPTTVIPS